MDQEKGNYLTIVAAAVLVLAVILGVWFFFFRSGEPSPAEENEVVFQTVPRLAPDRPRNLLQGYISGIDPGLREITVSVPLDVLFINIQPSYKEVRVKMAPDTRYKSIDVSTRAESDINFEDLKIWNDLTIVIAESVIEMFDKDLFNAREITIMEGTPFIN